MQKPIRTDVSKRVQSELAEDHDVSSSESAIEFAQPPDDSEDESSVKSTSSMTKVEQMLGREARRISPQPKEKRRPPALLHQRSLSTNALQQAISPEGPPSRRKDSTSGMSGHGGISVSSTIYPSSEAGARESFIDLDDIMSPSVSDTLLVQPRRSGEGVYADDELSVDSRISSDFYASTSRNPNAMYPTPRRNAFPHHRSPPSTAGSETSQIPRFAPVDRQAAVYQPPMPTPRRRQRPQSMIATPTPTASYFFDDRERERSRARAKPPLPKSPKPAQFLRKAAVASSGSSSPSSQRITQYLDPLPPTTNIRDPTERQELIRKHRKLAKVFGEGVGGMLWPTDDPHATKARARGVVPPSSRVTHRKGSLSADAHDDDRSQVLIIGPKRRHSTPTSAEFGEYSTMIQAAGNDDTNARGSGSPESFMELSDDEQQASRGDDALSTPNQSPEAVAEQERKKMRDKLAKLHRFLGSRVPVELALGAEYVLRDQDLPKPAPAASSSGDGESDPTGTKDGTKRWRRRRRSSLSAVLPGYVVVYSSGETSSEPLPASEERMKDELGEKERALNVKRAVKMERMFGARPPPTLYQTRAARAPSPPSSWPKPPSSELPVLPPVQRNPNTSAYKGKSRHKRPGTSESSQALLGEDLAVEGMSHAYMYYRHSLNSLTDIIDKDDKESLAELHQYINAPSGSDDEENTPGPSTNFTYPSSLERRRSLPARTSLQSIASTLTITPPAPNPRGFQQRRRRAAKLSHFFGVNYRDLFGDVLDSIEMGMQEEVSAGSLNEGELEDLLGKLRKLKVKRDEIQG